MLRWMAALGIAVLAGTFPLVATQPASEPASCPLHVQITDEDGTALPKAFVFIHNERGTNQQATPDRTGQVKASLRPGLYDLFVAAPGFVPTAQIVDLRSCKPQNLNLMMALDAEHTEGDK
jgi:uncharacterized membrane protein